MFHGDESDDYVDDPNHCMIKPLGDLVDADSTLEHVLGHPPGSAWEREEPGAVFVAVEDWDPTPRD